MNKLIIIKFNLKLINSQYNNKNNKKKFHNKIIINSNKMKNNPKKNKKWTNLMQCQLDIS